MSEVESDNRHAPPRIQPGPPKIVPRDGIFFSTVPCEPGKCLGMGPDPFKHAKRRFNLGGRDESGEEMVLEEMVRGVVLLFLLIDEARVLEMGDMGDETLFGDFPKGGLLQKGQKALVLGASKHGALHLPFRGFPGGSLEGSVSSLDNKELALLDWPGLVIEETRRAQIDTPAFGWMLDVGIGLFRVVREVSRASDQARLKDIEGPHRY